MSSGEKGEGRAFCLSAAARFSKAAHQGAFHSAFAQGSFLSVAPATPPPLRQLPGHLN